MKELINRLYDAYHRGNRGIDTDIVIKLGLSEECPFWLHSYYGTTPMRLTSQFNEALELFRRVLPEWELSQMGESSDGKWWISISLPYKGDDQGNITREGKTVGAHDCQSPAIALCIVILRAKLLENEK